MTIAESTQKLADLVSKIDVFVNGADDRFIATNAGSIKSLNGLVKQLKEINFVAKVIDFNTVADMHTNFDEIEEGQVARVLLDPILLNRGYYQKEPLGIFKISYADLFDLHDRFPDPYNKLVIELDESDTLFDKNIFSVRIPASAGFIQGWSVAGRLEYTSNVSGADFFYSNSFGLALCGRQAGFGGWAYTNSNELTIGGPAPDTLPSFDAVRATDASDNVFTVRLLPAKAGSMTIPGKVKIIFENLDTTKVQVL